MKFKPVINFRPTTIGRAFLVNAIFIGITTAFTIEARRIFNTSPYTKELPDRPHKLAATVLASIIIGFLAYLLCRFLFGLGGGMLSPMKPYTHFF